MCRLDEKQGNLKEEEQREEVSLSDTWSQDAQDELEDFIEQQGIYIRQ